MYCMHTNTKTPHTHTYTHTHTHTHTHTTLYVCLGGSSVTHDCLSVPEVSCPPQEGQTWDRTLLSPHGDFSKMRQTSDLNIGVIVATLPGVWCYMVSTETGWPSVSVLRLGEISCLICNFYHSMAAWTIVYTDMPLRHRHVGGTLHNKTNTTPHPLLKTSTTTCNQQPIKMNKSTIPWLRLSFCPWVWQPPRHKSPVPAAAAAPPAACELHPHHITSHQAGTVLQYSVNCLVLLTITRVPDQNGIPWLYNMLEIYHSGPKP